MTHYRLSCTGSDAWLEFSEDAARKRVLDILKEWARDELLPAYDPFGNDAAHCPKHETFSNECEDCVAEEYDRVHKLMDRDMARHGNRLWRELLRDGYAEVTESEQSIAFSVDVLDEG